MKKIKTCRENNTAGLLSLILPVKLAYKLFHILNGKRRFCQRLQRYRHKPQRVVIGVNAVGIQFSAALAAVYDRPFAALADPYRNSLHYSSAVTISAACFAVNVNA